MAKNFTEASMRELCTSLETLFDRVVLMDAEEPSSGLRVEYPAKVTGISCEVSVPCVVDGKPKDLLLRGPLADSSLMLDPRTAREQALYEDDLVRDFLTGARNRRYWETVFCPAMAEAAANGMPASFALIKIDHLGDMIKAHGQPVVDQVICCVANQWQRAFEEEPNAVICRLTGHTYAIGCIGKNAVELRVMLRNAYSSMNLTCTCTVGMMRRVSYTLSIACADASEAEDAEWALLYVLCDKRLRSLRAAGSNGVSEE